MKRKALTWISIAFILFCALFLRPCRLAQADLFGGDVAVLSQILVQTIQQLSTMRSILGQARDTASMLEELNRGVKEALRLADTAHVPLPQQVYDQAKSLDQALETAHQVYGVLPESAPHYDQMQYRSGAEGLFLSEDAFDYSTFLDKQGEKIKSSAVVASQPAATRLTAESLGVLLHAVSHSNRLEAKNLEIISTTRIENSAKDAARFNSFIESHQTLEGDLRGASVSPLNSFGLGDNQQ